MKSSLLLLFAILLLMPLPQALAKTGYISDVLVVTVRDQKGNNYNVLETLISNSPVEIIDEDKVYVRVRTPKGTEGYIRKQYISREIPKNIQIKKLNSEVAKLKQQLQETTEHSSRNILTADQQKQDLEQLTKQLTETESKLAEVTTAYELLQQDSGHVVSLKSENEQLHQENQQINSELSILREENQNFHRSNMIQWFLAGGGVFFGGWLVGKISRRKQRSFSRI